MGTCQLSPVRWISRLSTSVAQVTTWTQRFTEDVWQWYNMCAEHTWFKQFDPFYRRCAVSQALMRDRRGRRFTELVVRDVLRAPPHECPHVRELVAVVAHVVVGDDNDGPLAPHVYRGVDPVVVIPLALRRHFVDRVLLLQPFQNTLCGMCVSLKKHVRSPASKLYLRSFHVCSPKCDGPLRHYHQYALTHGADMVYHSFHLAAQIRNISASRVNETQ
jgi:hypothetical protein